jgi:hypothetical protein
MVACSGMAGLVAIRLDPVAAWSILIVAGCLYTALGVYLARVPVRSQRFLSAFLTVDEVPTKREVA